MKYYILDLTPKHSLVKYLVEHGHTVFMISWKNPKKKDRNLGMDDYLEFGIMSALKVINQCRTKRKSSLGGILSWRHINCHRYSSHWRVKMMNVSRA